MYIYDKDDNKLVLIHNLDIIKYSQDEEINEIVFNSRLKFISENLWRNKGYFVIEKNQISLVLPVEKESQQSINTSVHNHVESKSDLLKDSLDYKERSETKLMIQEIFNHLFPKKQKSKLSFLDKLKNKFVK